MRRGKLNYIIYSFTINQKVEPSFLLADSFGTSKARVVRHAKGGSGRLNRRQRRWLTANLHTL